MYLYDRKAKPTPQGDPSGRPAPSDVRPTNPLTGRDPVEADHYDIEDEGDDPVRRGVPWEDSHFSLPSTIWVKRHDVSVPLTDIEWIRPKVSTVSFLQAY